MELAQKAAKVIAVAALLTLLVFLLDSAEPGSSVPSVLPQGSAVNESPSPLASSPTMQPTATVAGIQGEMVRVQRVVDGDTIVLQDGRRVRYIGIDTPETVAPGKPVECAGLRATERNRELVEGQDVRLVKDVSETDRLGRLLRYVYTDDVFVNEVLVAEGLGNSSPYPPDIARQDILDAAERNARSAGKGIWSNECTNQVATSPVPSGCAIKGNISGGEKIYHTPGCSSYDRTKIDTTAGERMFCTEKEAVSAGWRKASNCTL